MCARSEVLGFTALGVTFRGGTQCIQSSMQLPTTQQRENLNLIPIRKGRTSLAFAGAGSRPMYTYLRPPLGSSSEEKVPLQTLPKEWLGLSLPSSHSDAGSRFFLLPNSFLKGWNLPAFFLSAGYKTERRGAEGRRGSAGLVSRHRHSRFKGRMRSKSKSPARSSPKVLAMEMKGCNSLLTHHIDTANIRALKHLLLGLRICLEVSVQLNIWTKRRDNFVEPEFIHYLRLILRLYTTLLF